MAYCARLNLVKPAAPMAAPEKEQEELPLVAPPRIDLNIMSRKSFVDIAKAWGHFREETIRSCASFCNDSFEIAKRAKSRSPRRPTSFCGL
jgi:hypothetical protein